MNSKILNNLKKLAMPFAIATSMVAGKPVVAIAENGAIEDVPTYDIQIEDHEVAVITTKVDAEKNNLEGATLQILNSEGEVVDEWISDGSEHTTMLPEGDYILHEVSAPEGYIVAEDQTFTVKVETFDLDAGVDFSETPCEHYGGTPLYYVESQGQKQEVYCINQDWETPDENSKYDGGVLKKSDIKNFTRQTVYVDAHQNKELIDVSDQSLSSEELYDKILDIVYHRSKASSEFSDLTEAEIRYVTEAALKNYTNAGLTRVQRVNVGKEPDNYQSTDYYVTDNGKYVWYLYPWYRSFSYDPTQPLGKDVFTTSIGNGDAFGNIARHWSSGHNAKNSEEVRAKLARFYDLYLYLISDNDHHPEDMHLYIYSTDNKATDLSGNDFDEGAYQNLLGVTWFNPYDEEYVVYLTVIDDKEIIPEIPEEPIVPEVPEEPNVPEEPKPEMPTTPEEPVKPEEPKEIKVIDDTEIPQLGDAIANEMLIALGAGVAGLTAVKVLKKRM